MKGRTNVGGGKPEEEKTVTAGTSVIEVNPSSGKAMKKVTVNPTPTESKSVTPTTSELTVTPSEGKHLSQVVVGAVEDVTPEVTAQTPVITQIAENLGVTITTPSGTNKQILQGNNANLLNIKDNAKKEGAYVWKKLTKSIVVTFVQTSYNPITLTVSSSDIDLGTVDKNWFVGIKCSFSWATAVYAFEFMENNVFVIWTADGKSHLYEGTYSYNPSNKTLTTDINPSGSFGINSSATKQGNFLDFVVSDSPTAYPDGGTQDGYWYERSNTSNNGIFINSFTDDGYPSDILIKSDTQPPNSFLTGSGWSKLSNIVVDTVSIGSNFITTLNNFAGKLKLKNVTSITGDYVFYNIGKDTGTNAKVFIPSTCQTIEADSMSFMPFENDKNPINIYCEAEKKPSGWGAYWNLVGLGHGYHNTLWGVSETDFDAL